MTDMAKDVLGEDEAALWPQNRTKNFGDNPGKGYTIEERVIIHLQKARALLDEAHAIPGAAHWKLSIWQ